MKCIILLVSPLLHWHIMVMGVRPGNAPNKRPRRFVTMTNTPISSDFFVANDHKTFCFPKHGAGAGFMNPITQQCFRNVNICQLVWGVWPTLTRISDPHTILHYCRVDEFSPMISGFQDTHYSRLVMLQSHLVKDEKGWIKFRNCVRHEMRVKRSGMQEYIHADYILALQRCRQVSRYISYQQWVHQSSGMGTLVIRNGWSYHQEWDITQSNVQPCFQFINNNLLNKCI